jgi:arsenate reductase
MALPHPAQSPQSVEVMSVSDGVMYWWKRCGTCRKAHDFVTQAGETYDERDYFTEQVTREELLSLLDGRSPSEIFSFKSPTAKALGVKPGTRSDDELLDLMIGEPRLLRRPLLKLGDRLLIGFDADEWKQAIS